MGLSLNLALLLLVLSVLLVSGQQGCPLKEAQEQFLQDEELTLEMPEGEVPEIIVKEDQAEKIVREPAKEEKKEPIVQEFIIDADDAGFYPSSIGVLKGDKVKITFNVRSQNVYFGGLDFRASAWGDTGKISPGKSTTVEFIADESFEFKSYWPSSNALKATGRVDII